MFRRELTEAHYKSYAAANALNKERLSYLSQSERIVKKLNALIDANIDMHCQ